MRDLAAHVAYWLLLGALITVGIASAIGLLAYACSRFAWRSRGRSARRPADYE